MPPKKSKPRRGVTTKQAEKIARQQAYKMIPKKIQEAHGKDFHSLINSASWLLIKPATIDYGVNNYEREGDQIFVEKCNGYFNVSFSSSTTNRVEIRELVGFYKGSTDPSRTNAFTASQLHTDLGSKMASWDRDNYLIKHDKKYDLIPEQIYEDKDLTGTTVNRALWKSKNIRLSLPLYRKYRYTNSNEGATLQQSVDGGYASQNEPTGWIPFIALQVRCPDQDFTGSTGSNAGPYIDYQFRTMFKDLK